MTRSAAERKEAQRARLARDGITKVEVYLDKTEMGMLQRNCALRRPGREPYSAEEYVGTLIRRDDAALKDQIKAMCARRCGKCGDQLPVAECCHSGDSQCWITRGWHETKLSI